MVSQPEGSAKHSNVQKVVARTAELLSSALEASNSTAPLLRPIYSFWIFVFSSERWLAGAFASDKNIEVPKVPNVGQADVQQKNETDANLKTIVQMHKRPRYVEVDEEEM